MKGIQAPLGRPKRRLMNEENRSPASANAPNAAPAGNPTETEIPAAPLNRIPALNPRQVLCEPNSGRPSQSLRPPSIGWPDLPDRTRERSTGAVFATIVRNSALRSTAHASGKSLNIANAHRQGVRANGTGVAIAPNDCAGFVTPASLDRRTGGSSECAYGSEGTTDGPDQ